MQNCEGINCPIRDYCRCYQNIHTQQALHIAQPTPCEIADGLVSCAYFVFNGREYIETLTLKDILEEHLRKKHGLKHHNSEENYFSQTTLDAVVATHIETSCDRSVFAVYSIFSESDEGDVQEICAKSFVLKADGKVARECSLPSQTIHF